MVHSATLLKSLALNVPKTQELMVHEYKWE